MIITRSTIEGVPEFAFRNLPSGICLPEFAFRNLPAEFFQPSDHRARNYFAEFSGTLTLLE